MRVFISWSGEMAHEIAIEFQKWLKKVLQASESFVSSEDISKGSFWSRSILDELAKCNAGVIIVTPDNYTAPWLNFEAGALVNGVSNGTTKPPVCPLLIDVAPSSLPTPMSLLQLTTLEQSDVVKLVEAMSEAVQPPLVPKDIIAEAVGIRWDRLIESIETAKSKVKAKPAVKEADTETMLREILDHTRSMVATRTINSLTSLFEDRTALPVRFTRDGDTIQMSAKDLYDYAVRQGGGTASIAEELLRTQGHEAFANRLRRKMSLQQLYDKDLTKTAASEQEIDAANMANAEENDRRQHERDHQLK